VTEVLQLPYQRVSIPPTSAALAEFLGSGPGLSASTVPCLTECREAEHEQ